MRKLTWLQESTLRLPPSSRSSSIIADAGWWQVYAPLAQLGLARAYAMEGDREKSRKAYDDFFTTWKDADPNIPILRQAKAEYEKLISSASANTPAPEKKP